MYTREERLRRQRKLERLALIKQRYHKLILLPRESGQGVVLEIPEADLDFDFSLELN
jgi:hypothetical protein